MSTPPREGRIGDDVMVACAHGEHAFDVGVILIIKDKLFQHGILPARVYVVAKHDEL